MIRFLANENFPLPSIRRLRTAGYSVAALAEDGSGSTDHDVLARAVRDSQIILTFDRDYGELIFRYKQPVPVGVVFCRFIPLTAEEPAERILWIIDAGIEFADKFTVVERDHLRQRPLR